MTWQIIPGHVLNVLAEMEPESVHLCVTSPPYWGLRDYGLEPQVWGGQKDCQHDWGTEKILKAGTHESWLDYMTDGLSRGNPENKRNKIASQGQFCSLCGAWLGSLGLEPTPELYLAHMVEVMQAVKRVMRKDGCCFINIGDSMWGGKGQSSQAWLGQNLERTTLQKAYHHLAGKGETRPSDGKHPILKPGDLCLIPEQLVIALQKDGWYIRSVIIWAKGREGDIEECGPGSVMPESVNGVSWQRHKVKIGKKALQNGGCKTWQEYAGREMDLTGWTDCPGCPKCLSNDGLVLRWGSWRPTRAFEYIYMLTKSAKYWADGEGVRQFTINRDWSQTGGNIMGKGLHKYSNGFRDLEEGRQETARYGRNLRNVWLINPESATWAFCKACGQFFESPRFQEADPGQPEMFEGAGVGGLRMKDGKRQCSCGATDGWVDHFATFSSEMVELCIKAGSPEKVCSKCGQGWARVIERSQLKVTSERGQYSYQSQIANNGFNYAGAWLGEPGKSYEQTTLGFRPTCTCNADSTPATVLDIFAGSGVTLLTALKLGRRALGIELSPDYVRLARARIEHALNKGSDD